MNFTAAEFQRTLSHIAVGDVDVGSILTGVVEPEQAMEAFDGLRDPERHAKMVISFAAQGFAPFPDRQDSKPEYPHA